MAKKHLNVNKGFFFKYELLFSTSYLELTKSARDLLHCLTMELDFSRKGNRISHPNNGSVSYTEIQFKEEFRRASNTYLTARNQLIKNGLIRLTYRVGMCRGDMATYKILAIYTQERCVGYVTPKKTGSVTYLSKRNIKLELVHGSSQKPPL